MGDEDTVKPNGGSSWKRAARWALAAIAALGAFHPAKAEAQSRTFYLDRLFMAGQPDDAIGMWRPHLGERTRLFGQLGFGFAYEPFRIQNMIESSQQRGIVRRDTGGDPLDAQLITYADIGVEALDRFSFQVQLPAVLVQTGHPTATANAPEANDNASPTIAAVMDVRIDGRVILFRNESRSFKLGAQASVWIPTGNANSYASDGSAAGGIGLGLEYDAKKFFLLANLGMQFRGGGSLNSFTAGHEFRYALGGFIPSFCASSTRSGWRPRSPSPRASISRSSASRPSVRTSRTCAGSARSCSCVTVATSPRRIRSLPPPREMSPCSSGTSPSPSVTASSTSPRRPPRWSRTDPAGALRGP